MKSINNKCITVCIPTYNRSQYLKECLDSIMVQLNDEKIKKRVEIVISDNASTDNTEEIVNKYKKKIKKISYFKNTKNIGPVKNVIKVAKYATTEYVWFFSDDDLQNKDALRIILSIIDRENPDIIFSNVSIYSNNLNETINNNCLDINNDIILNTRKSLFNLLTQKFPYKIDWLTTFYSNIIIEKRILFQRKNIFNKYSSEFDMFPHALPIYYLLNNLNVYIIAKPLLKFRENNRSFGPTGKYEFLSYWDKVLSNHYKNIYELNKNYISWDFLPKLVFKNLLRKLHLQYVKYV